MNKQRQEKTKSALKNKNDILLGDTEVQIIVFK